MNRLAMTLAILAHTLTGSHESLGSRIFPGWGWLAHGRDRRIVAL